MAADNTTNQRNPLGSDNIDGPFNYRPNLDPIKPDPIKPKPPRVDPIPSTGLGQGFRKTTPSTVLVCLDCETYYPEGDGWEYCPNCSAKVFEVSKD